MLPAKYIPDSLEVYQWLKDIEIRRGWVITAAQARKIAQWVMVEHPARACLSTTGELDASRTFALSGRFFLRHMGLDGGVSTCQLKDGIANIVYVDTNYNYPEEYTKPQEWKEMTEYLGLEGPPSWYLVFTWD